MGGAINWGGQSVKPIYTGGFSAGGGSRGSSRGSSGSTQNVQRLQSNTPTSTATPSTRRASNQPEDIYKKFPNDTGRNDVPFQDRFRTTPADAQTGGSYLSGTTQQTTADQTTQGTGQTTTTGGTPGEPVSPLRPPEGGGPGDVAGPVTIPDKPSYLDRPELPDYTEQFRDYEAQTREVQPMETMQGQMQNIMEEGNPLMDLRRSQADQLAASRGLFHSTAGVEAAERAMIDAILPIASQDAATHSNQQRINQEFIQDASNMNTETFNSEIVAKANQGRQMQLMSFESDVRERLAGVDQRYAIQLETLSKEYDILGEEYKQAGTLYSDALRSMATLLGNNNLTPEQQAAGVQSLVGQLEAGLQFMTGVTGGTTGGGSVGDTAEPQGAVTVDGQDVAGISNESNLGVYPGGEMNASGQFADATLKALDPLQGLVSAHAPDPDIVRIDQSSGLPSLMKVGNWYYRPKGWNEGNGLGSSQMMESGDGKLYLEFQAMEQPEQQRINDRSNDWIRENPGGARIGGADVAKAPPVFLEINR